MCAPSIMPRKIQQTVGITVNPPQTGLKRISLSVTSLNNEQTGSRYCRYRDPCQADVTARLVVKDKPVAPASTKGHRLAAGNALYERKLKIQAQR